MKRTEIKGILTLCTRKRIMHRKLSTGVDNFGEKYEKIKGFDMLSNICFVYNLDEAEKGWNGSRFFEMDRNNILLRYSIFI